MTVGILYPGSNAHPDIGVDFMGGLKVFIQETIADAQPRLLLEGIGFGGSEKEVYEKAEKLLRIEKADMLIAFIDLKVLPILEPLLYSTGKIMLVVNAGANYPHNWVPQPNIIFLTLHHAFLCRLSGLLAAQPASANAAMATTFFDCGYFHTTAMVNGFTQQGGSITFNYVNNQPYNDAFEISQLTEFLAANNNTHKLLCAFDSLPASLFYNRLQSYQDANGLQLFVSPMMLEDNTISSGSGGYPFSIEGYMPWKLSLSNNANHHFTISYKAFAKKEASIFSLLGWEAGIIVQQVLQLYGNETYSGTDIMKHLKQVTLSSPRGELKLDDETHYFLTPAIKCKIIAGNTAVEIVPLEAIEKYWNEFIAQSAEGISSGWTNTYLCY